MNIHFHTATHRGKNIKKFKTEECGKKKKWSKFSLPSSKVAFHCEVQFWTVCSILYCLQHAVVFVSH